jgi:leader peptidase (prepilin peptidase)/N-methyltransferase
MTTGDPVQVVFGLFALAFGGLFGSFANVCIYRLPLGLSIVRPGSRCPACGHPVRPFDNVPVLAWLLLRGRCRDCRVPIPIRYPLVEALVAFLFLGSFVLFGPSLFAVAGAVLATAAVILTATDLEHRILPDEVTLGAMTLGLVLAGTQGFSVLLESAAGALLGAGVLFGIRAGYQAIRGVEGMGLGDVKMGAMIGALSGASGVFVTFLFASLAGALFGLFLTALRQVVWAAQRRKSGPCRGDLLLDGHGRIAFASRKWSSIPGAAAVGNLPGASGPAARPLVALLRLARRRRSSGKGLVTFGRIVVESGDDFRVVAARVEPSGEQMLLQLFRVDIPFGVFLAFGSLLAFTLGRMVLQGVLQWPSSWLGSLLP